MLLRSRYLGLLIAALILLFCVPAQTFAAPVGHFLARVQDDAGDPIEDVLVGLTRQSSREALATLPILSRTDENGRISVKNLEGGDYQVLVKSAKYQGPEETVIEVQPGKTTVVTLVLQQLLNLGSFGEENVSIKTLLRSGEENRLVFRYRPEFEEEKSFSESLFEKAVFEIYSSGGLDGDYFVFPEDGASGTTTNFALLQSNGLNSKYILAGQLNSGEDSLWRIKNFIEYPLSKDHALQMFVGYGRMSFDQPSLSLLNNPLTLVDNADYTRAVGTMKTLSLGLQETLRLSNALSLMWGVELDQVEFHERHTFINPSAEISYSPVENTRVKLLMASKRNTHRSSLTLPDGDVVNLSDAVQFSRVDNRLSVGTSRYYQGSISQQVDPVTEVEFAAFENDILNGYTPLLAVFESHPGMEILYLDEDHGHNQGYRMTVRRDFSPNLKASVSYIRAKAPGLEWEGTALVFDSSAIGNGLISEHHYNAIFTEIRTRIPSSGTHLSALIKVIPDGNPVATLDAFSDIYETGNQGINLFVRQVIPVPAGWLSLMGLDFLSGYTIEALLDLRNLTNENVGTIESGTGDVVTLLRSPRTVRGGISVRF